MITKVRSHLSQNEPLLFERSSPGKRAYQLPELDVPAVDAAEALGARKRARRNRRLSRRSAKWRPSAISRAFPPGTTPSITACIRWAPAP